MAWAFVAHRGVAISNAGAGTTIAVSPSAAVAVGRVLVVRCVSDNLGTTSGQSTEHSVADSKNNTYTKVREQRRSAGASQDGVVASVWYSVIATQLETTDTVTLTVGAASYARGIGLDEFSVASGATVAVASHGGGSGASTTPSAAVSGLASQEYLFLGHVGVEGVTTDGFTQDADYTSLTRFGTAIGITLANVVSNGARRIATLTGDTYNPTLGTSRDWAAILGALREVDVISKSASDAGVGTDAFGALMAGLIGAETGSGSDATVSMLAGLTAQESGVGSDLVQALLAMLPIATDAGLGTEQPSSVVILMFLSASDAGAGAEGVSVLDITQHLSAQDSGAGSDVVASILALLTGTDSGQGADVVTSLLAALSAVDAGSGTDSGALLVMLPIATDAGTGVEGPTALLILAPITMDLKALMASGQVRAAMDRGRLTAEMPKGAVFATLPRGILKALLERGILLARMKRTLH